MATCFGLDDGVTVISGTGAAVHGRKSGRIEKAGGWGQLLGDRGGGYHLAMQGLRHLLSQYDLTHEITPLAQKILQTLALNRLEDLVDWASRADKMSVARLAPAVFEAARFGESEMLDIVESGARILVEFTRSVVQRLDFPDAPVRLVGGIFAHHPEYVALFKYRASVLLPKAQVELCTRSGAFGAAWLAEAEPRPAQHPEARIGAAPVPIIQVSLLPLRQSKAILAPRSWISSRPQSWWSFSSRKKIA
jgi:N-acetylglucosamine kinase-like BadF-type ATPase